MAAPSGYQNVSLPTGVDTDIFNLIKSHFMQNSPDLFNQLGGLATGRGQAFEQLEMPMRRKLQEDVLPQIGMQFGLSGNQKSSGFQNTLSRAGQSFSEDLAGQRYGIQMNALSQLLGMGNLLLNSPTQQYGFAEKPNALSELMKLLGGGLGMGIGNIPNMFRL